VKEFLKIGVSGVRGIVGESFTPQLAASFARAFAAYVGGGAVVVGRDTRPSGFAMQCAAVSGLQSAGCTPVAAGVIPTPSLCVLVRHLRARGGIGITASHNPARWNAMKFINSDGMFLSAQRAAELYDVYHQGDFPLAAEEAIQAADEPADPVGPHIDRVIDYVDVGSIRKRAFSVAVDCCNGVGALSARRFLERLGCRVVSCFDKPTGEFERGAEPLPENLGVLRELVRREGCDVGFAQDPDGDRLAIVDNTGEAIGEDITLAMAVWEVLDRHGKGPVAINLSSSRCVQDVAERRGCRVIRTKIGETHVVESMLASGAVVGGEGSNGGVIIPAIHPCRDSYAAMAIVLELMAAERKTVAQLRAQIPRYHVVKASYPLQGIGVASVLRSLRRKYEHMKTSFVDGVYVEIDDSWFHVRASNTEAVLRITAEAPTADAAARLSATLRAEIEDAARAL